MMRCYDRTPREDIIEKKKKNCKNDYGNATGNVLVYATSTARLDRA